MKNEPVNAPGEAEQLKQFVFAIAAARRLLQQANHTGCLIEGMALYASLADGLLRIGLVLKHQLDQQTSNIPAGLLYQPASTYISERQIYSRALASGIIGQSTFDELSDLYTQRNKAIHRFLISGITYNSLAPFLERYEVLFKALFAIVYGLEKMQIDRGIGMTGRGNVSSEAQVWSEVRQKIFGGPVQ
jgi:hypothetical protein